MVFVWLSLLSAKLREPLSGKDLVNILHETKHRDMKYPKVFMVESQALSKSSLLLPIAI